MTAENEYENWVLFGYRHEKDANGVEAQEGTPTFIAVAVERGATDAFEIESSGFGEGESHGEVVLRVPVDADRNDIRQALMNVADDLDVRDPRVHFEPDDTHALVELTQYLWRHGVISAQTFQDMEHGADLGAGMSD